MKLKKNIATSEAGFIFNPSTGDSFSVNQTGAEILALLKQDIPRENIISTITEKFDISSNQAEKDLEDFISQLTIFNLIEK